MDINKELQFKRKQIKALKEKADEANLKRAKAEATLEHLRQQESEILSQVKEIGYESIDELREDLAKKMETLNELLAKLTEQVEGLGDITPNENVEMDVISDDLVF